MHKIDLISVIENARKAASTVNISDVDAIVLSVLKDTYSPLPKIQ